MLKLEPDSGQNNVWLAVTEAAILRPRGHRRRRRAVGKGAVSVSIRPGRNSLP